MTTTYVSSGVTSGVTIFVGNTISVFSSGSTLDVVLSGGLEIVSDGGISNSTHIKNHGTETILQGGISKDASISAGGRMYVSSGGRSYSTNILKDGALLVESGGVSRDTTDLNGSEFVYSGGTAIDTTVDGANQSIDGGKSVGTMLYLTKSSALGGTVQSLNSGGISSATNIGSGTEQDVGGYGETSATGDSIAYNTIDGGNEYVSSSGETSGTMILAGGSEYLYSAGASYGTKVSNGGTEFVSSGGVAVGTKVFSGGTEIISSNGVASNTSIEANGELEILSGGKATGGITFAGNSGELVIDSTTMPGAEIKNFQAGDSIVLAAVPYSAGDTATVEKAGIVTVSASGHEYNLHIAGATVGETDFVFGPGSILTKSDAPQMTFLRPPVDSSAAVEQGWHGPVSAATLTAADFMPKIAGGIEGVSSSSHVGSLHSQETPPMPMGIPVSITQPF